jgi:acetyl-CoA carboxylase carboxyltransferase component
MYEVDWRSDRLAGTVSEGSDRDEGVLPGEITKAEATAELRRRRALALAMGGPERLERLRAQGKLNARERVAALVDGESFIEFGRLAISDRLEIGERAPADASITGVGTVEGRKVAVIANDATVLAGSTGRVGSRKQGQLMSLAARKGYPLVMLGDANGGRLPDLLGSDFASAAGGDEGEHFLGVGRAPVRFPRVTVILGHAYGDPAFWAGSSDLVVLAKGASVALSGPGLVGASTGAAATHEELGGEVISARTSGLVNRVEPDEPSAIAAARRFLAYLPSRAGLEPPRTAAAEPSAPSSQLAATVPDRGRRGYDMHKVLDSVLDAGSYFELHREYGRSVLVGLARVGGTPVGVVANQPKFRGGVIDAAAADKVERLVDLCSGFGLPLIFLQDMPGVMIGLEAERAGIARKLIALYTKVAQSPVPKVTVVIRKAFGFGYMTLGGPNLGTDYVVAWPNAEIGFMSADNALQVLHHRRLTAERAAHGTEAADALAAQLEREVHASFPPWKAAEQSLIHDVIAPEETRQALLAGLFLGTGYR